MLQIQFILGGNLLVKVTQQLLLDEVRINRSFHINSDGRVAEAQVQGLLRPAEHLGQLGVEQPVLVHVQQVLLPLVAHVDRRELLHLGYLFLQLNNLVLFARDPFKRALYPRDTAEQRVVPPLCELLFVREVF